ncbi:MAG: hypothetical protein VX966_06385 [Chloroflexota bacterium]|nr:hypothetical protein [Chloroflexota bacterium]
MKNKSSLHPRDLARALSSTCSGQYDRYLNYPKHAIRKEMVSINHKYVVYEVLDE